MLSGRSPSIILASGSPRRKELLEGLGLTFSVQPSEASETVEENVTPAEFVEILARRKALEVAARTAESGQQGTLIVGSDTVVVLNGEILGKPVDEAHAFRMLSELQGKSHTVYTGLSVVETGTGRERTGHRATQVTMRPLSAEQIKRYIATGEPMDKAGAYAIQGYGAIFISNMDGDYFSVVGLPIQLVSDFLEEFGVQLL
ncbi:Maf family protein [Aneurinibacillus tyrosinisolvens]|uniref:Maf family protein n=1 Tax=Aneurinibacillus tyrosinisolvens TaxID=1443435 RepID=UPI00063F5B8E|nr:Maf family protein [Aneurinibacillus tyrosinisolvens]